MKHGFETIDQAYRAGYSDGATTERLAQLSKPLRRGAWTREEINKLWHEAGFSESAFWVYYPVIGELIELHNSAALGCAKCGSSEIHVKCRSCGVEIPPPATKAD